MTLPGSRRQSRRPGRIGSPAPACVFLRSRRASCCRPWKGRGSTCAALRVQAEASGGRPQDCPVPPRAAARCVLWAAHLHPCPRLRRHRRPVPRVSTEGPRSQLRGRNGAPVGEEDVKGPGPFLVRMGRTTVKSWWGSWPEDCHRFLPNSAPPGGSDSRKWGLCPAASRRKLGGVSSAGRPGLGLRSQDTWFRFSF